MVGVVTVGACGPLSSSAAPDGLGVRHGYWRAQDRVLISDFSEMGAAASDRRFVFGASENGVVMYDHRAQLWSAPLTAEDGFPRGEVPVSLELDSFTGQLWMITGTGALYSYDVTLGNEWRWVGVVPVASSADLVAHEGSLWIATDAGWFESSPGGGSPIRASPPPAVQAARGGGLAYLERESAAFRSAGSTLTVDEWLRRFQITAAASTSDPSRWFLSTWGGGLFAYDDRMLDAEQMPFGSIGRGVSAIAETIGGGGFWFGSDGLGQRRGVAYADRELQRWSWHQAGRIGGGSAGPVNAIIETPIGVFVGGEDGLFRMVGDRWLRLTDGDALPSTAVRSLAWAENALWAGTDRGLARLTAGAEIAAVGVTRIDGTSGARINALAHVDSLLWVATDRGLLRLNLATGNLSQPPLDDARLRGRVIGVAYDEPSLYALTESALLVHDGAAWTAPPITASIAGIGRPTHLAVREGVVWIAGSAGALGFDPLSGAETLLSVPNDIPEGPVRQVLPTAGGAWFATPAGALLIRFE